MTIIEINLAHKKIEDLLRDRRIKNVFEKLEEISTNMNNSMDNLPLDFSSQTEELMLNYKQMLKYSADGIKDPERDNIYIHLIRSLYELNDKIRVYILDNMTNIFPFNKKSPERPLIKIIEDIHTITLKSEKFLEVQDDIFSSCISHQNFCFEELNAIKNFVINPPSQEWSTPHAQLIISAIYIRLQKKMEIDLMILLCDFTASKHSKIRQRSLVSLVLCMYLYDEKLNLYPSWNCRFEALKEDLKIVKEVEFILFQLIGSRETESIIKKMHEDILPEIKKIPNIKNKVNLEEFIKEESNDDGNPDWGSITDKYPDLADKLIEISNLHESGADVMMGSFSQMKRDPFFNKTSNWFLPYFKNNPVLNNLFEDSLKNMLSQIEKINALCDSDKYSFCFLLSSVQNQSLLKDSILGQFEQDGKDLDEGLANKLTLEDSKEYIQDLYRFFKIHPNNLLTPEIFGLRFDFYNKRFIFNLIRDKCKHQLANYYFSKGYYNEASELFIKLLENEPRDTQELQKLAYCLQQNKQYEMAIEYYLKADLYSPATYWHARKIAYCYRNLGNIEEAYNWYLQAERLRPDDIKNQISIGYCLLQFNRFPEALKVFFKIEYLSTEITKTKIWRPITWCSFMTGKLGQAQKYSNLTIGQKEDPNPQDLITRGHIEWCRNGIKYAIKYYKKSIELKIDVDTLMNIINDDKMLLISQGVQEKEFPLMLDYILYNIKNKNL